MILKIFLWNLLYSAGFVACGLCLIFGIGFGIYLIEQRLGIKWMWFFVVLLFVLCLASIGTFQTMQHMH
jgi:hypothetical protein